MHIDELEGLDEETRKKIEELQKVTREKYGNDVYTSAQMHLGNLLYENNKIKDALSAWYNINEMDVREIFISAQWSISIVLVEENNIEGALSIWRTVERSDNSEIYAQAQWNIGVAADKDGNIETALSAWRNIKPIDDTKIYAQAQFSIGLALYGRGDIEEALLAWSKVIWEDHSEKYVKAQWLTGLVLYASHDDTGALLAWSNIEFADDSKIYRQAQYKIGQLLICDHESKEYGSARDAFINAESAYPYEAYCYKKICDLLLDAKLEIVGEKAWQLLDKTLEIVEILQLEFGQDFHKEKFPERKLAHYTSTDTANLLLESNEETGLPSAFRLNTINNVNDPSEGQLLLNYLKGIKEKSFHAPDFDDKLHAFIGCFTFNHDSLNQFRLYGKQDNKEASGVSLVFRKEFFQSYDALEGLSFLSLRDEVQSLNNDIVINKQSIMEEKTDDEISLSKKPVMRCVYLDPTSDYIHLAQRNRLTFFREFGDEKIKISDGNIDIIWADVEWEKYKFELRSKTKDFGKAFKELKKIYKELNKQISNLKNVESDTLIDVNTLANEIILPLKYLIKHSAFQEEQECRMVYITSMNAPEVIMDSKKFLFVNYEASVKENLNKVYIAPAATEYQLYLAWLLRNTNVKIELSNNPYRQT